MRLYADRNRLTNKLFKLKMQMAKILIIIQTPLTLEKKPKNLIPPLSADANKQPKQSIREMVCLFHSQRHRANWYTLNIQH
jgi:hypothetical protein